MPHFQLQLRQITKHGGMVRGKGVAVHIRHPMAESSGAAQGLPLALPIAGDVAVALANTAHTTQGNRPPAASIAFTPAVASSTSPRA